MPPRPKSVFCLIAALLLAGCAQNQLAAWQTSRHYLGLASAADQHPLRPDYQYLRVVTNGEVALLVLGYTDLGPTGRPVQVWYSAGKEVLRLQDGRLVGLAGVPLEWRNVVLSADLPAWRDITTPRSFRRQRDEMPGYRIGLQEQITVRPITAPSGTRLMGTEVASLRWFEETTAPLPDTAPALATHFRPLPPARYAVGPAGAVYGEQCLDAQLCISWQSWPPQRKEN